MLLHENKELFKQILKEVSDNLGLDEFQIEKDYYVSLLLKSISTNPDLSNVVFKGGTSLSKCYGVIKRFSEDIDISVKFESRRLGDGQRRKIKYAILNEVEKLGMVVVNKTDIQSDRDFIQYHVNYDEFKLGDISNKGLLPTILIESMYIYQPYPCKKLNVNSYIANYLQEYGHDELVVSYNLEPFTMNVQTIERTFIDKLFAICDYHLSGKYQRYSRHVYDIHMIWKSGILDIELTKDILPNIVEDRMKSKVNASCQLGQRPTSILREIIDAEVYRADYNRLTAIMIYDHVSYETCIASLEEILGLEIIPEEIKQFSIQVA